MREMTIVTPGRAYNDSVLRQQVSKTVRMRNIGAG